MTIYELTNHESGVIIYGGNAVAAVNWSSFGDDQIPMLSPLGGQMIGWTEDGIFDDVQCRRVSDWRKLLPGSVWLAEETDNDGARIADTDMDIVFDQFSDFVRAFLDDDYCDGDFEATIYDISDGRSIIVPDIWN